MSARVVPARIIINDNGKFTLAWASDYGAGSLAWGDYDSDGDLDLAMGNAGGYRVYRRSRTGFPVQPNTPSIVSLTAIQPLANVNFAYANAIARVATAPITHTLFDPEGDVIPQIRATYSPDGGGKWYPAIAESGTLTQNLTPRCTWKAAALPALALASNGVVTSSVWLTPTVASRATNVVENHSGVSGTFRAWGVQAQDTVRLSPPQAPPSGCAGYRCACLARRRRSAIPWPGRWSIACRPGRLWEPCRSRTGLAMPGAPVATVICKDAAILHAVINCNFSQSCHCEPLRLRRAAKQSVRLQIRDCFGCFAPSQ